MKLEQLRKFCSTFPHVTEDIKWGSDLCFCIGGKMFAVTNADTDDGTVSLKCTPEKFAELTEIEGVIPAPYVARYHWIAIEKPNAIAERELKDLISKSYHLVFDKLPAKARKELTK